MPSLFWFAGCLLLVMASAGDPLPFLIKTQRADDRVEVQVEKDRTVFSIRSPFGIGRAVVERKADRWPKNVVLRLHLKGLENFRIGHAKGSLHAAVGSGDGTVRQWKDGKEDAPLQAGDPLRMTIRLIGADGKPVGSIPLKNGYFEVALPPAFFRNAPPTFTLDWIDFYRN